MAWQPYVDEMKKNGNVEDAAVIGAADALIWAASPGFALSTYDIEVNVDIDTKSTVNVNEGAIVLERKLSLT